MKRNDKGFSLIELVVAIAIMTVLVGLCVYSVSLLFGTQARGLAQNVSAMLNETKTGSLSRFNETMTLSYRTKDDADDAIVSDGYYAENRIYTINNEAGSVQIGGENSSEIRKMGSGKVVITVYLSNDTWFELGQDRSVTISYDRSSGAFAPVMVDGVETSLYAEKITFASGLKTYTITMIPETGKHTLQ